MKPAGFLNSPLFTISLGKREFKPALIPTIVTIILLYLLTSLGQWQLRRAEYKENIQHVYNERKDLPPVELALAPRAIDDRSFIPVVTYGSFDIKHQILLDNRVVNHRAGYDVYTPFIKTDGRAILVNRGWIKMGRTRQDLPDISLIEKKENITGMLSVTPSHGLVLSDNANQYNHWPAVAQYIDLDEIQSQLGYELYPMILISDKSHRSTLHREPFIMNMGSAKHLGYAFQWFGLAITLFIIYLVVNTKQAGNSND